MLTKLIFTLRNFKKTAYHHYGDTPWSLVRFIYYSGISINTFCVFEYNLSQDLHKCDLEPEYFVMKSPLDKLVKVRDGLDLPREFYYDKTSGARLGYLIFRLDELAGIRWILYKGDYSRFLKLSDGVGEFNYTTILPEFRGKRLASKAAIYILRELKEMGFKKVMVVIHKGNYQAIRCAELAGFKEIRKMRSIGPFNRKLRV